MNKIKSLLKRVPYKIFGKVFKFIVFLKKLYVYMVCLTNLIF